MFFKKKKEKVLLFNPVDGNIKSITEALDPVFAQKLLGDGFIVEPQNGSIYSPIEGQITSIFPIKHAIGITTSQGKEFLVHMGVNTVELNGAGFEILIKEDESVTQDSLLAKIDLNKIKDAGYVPDIIVVITNSGNSVVKLNRIGEASHGTEIGLLEK